MEILKPNLMVFVDERNHAAIKVEIETIIDKYEEVDFFVWSSDRNNQPQLYELGLFDRVNWHILFFISPLAEEQVSLNPAFQQVIFNRQLRGFPTHVVVPDDWNGELPEYFGAHAAIMLSTLKTGISRYFRVLLDEAQPKLAAPSDIFGMVQRVESRMQVKAQTSKKANGIALRYQIITVQNPKIVNDRKVIAAFVAEPFSVEKACEDIWQNHSSWKSTAIKLAILRKPRESINRRVRKESVAEHLRIPESQVFFADEYLNYFTASPAESPLSEGTEKEQPYVPIAAQIERSNAPSSVTEDAEKDLLNWANSHDQTIAVIAGQGGTGKTHLLKRFKRTVERQGSVLVHTVPSSTFFDAFQESLKRGEPIDGYDVFLQTSRDTVSLSRAQFSDNWNNGNIILAIDGIDEIAARLPGTFSLNEFLLDLKNSNREGFGKVLVTVRDYLIVDETGLSPLKMQLKLFNKQRARDFFEAIFEQARKEEEINVSPRRVDSALNMADQFLDGGIGYTPFILELIALLNLEDNDDDDELTDAFAASVGDSVTDRIVFGVFNREARRFGDDELIEDENNEYQFRIFEQLATTGRIGFHGETIDSVVLKILPSEKPENFLQFFKSHVLLQTQQENTFGLRFDFMSDYFIARAVAQLVIEASEGQTEIDLPAPVAQVLIERRGLADFVVIEAARFLSAYDRDVVLFGVRNTIDHLLAKTGQGRTDHLIASFVNILIQCISRDAQRNCSVAEAIELVVRELFSDDLGSVRIVENLCISRIPSKEYENRSLEFSDLRLKSCSFDAYDDFWLGGANEGTMFEGCTIQGCIGADVTPPHLRRKHMGESNILDQFADQKLLKGEVADGNVTISATTSLYQILTKFRSSVEQYRGSIGGNKFRGQIYSGLEIAGSIKLNKFIDLCQREKVLSLIPDNSRNHLIVVRDAEPDVVAFVDKGILKGRVKRLVARIEQALK